MKDWVANRLKLYWSISSGVAGSMRTAYPAICWRAMPPVKLTSASTLLILQRFEERRSVAHADQLHIVQAHAGLFQTRPQIDHAAAAEIIHSNLLAFQVAHRLDWRIRVDDEAVGAAPANSVERRREEF